MEMNQLEGQRVKLSAGTITIKDENGKTRGMVRGVRRRDRWSNAEQFSYFPALKKSGIWGSKIRELVNNVVLAGNTLYYLNDLRPLETYARLKAVFESSPVYSGEAAHNAERMKVAEQAAQYMTVINCYII